jgi:hypothetical protein
MRSYGVEDPFPVAELTIELFHFKRAGRDLVKLLGVGAVGAFDGAVEFERTGWQHESAPDENVAVRPQGQREGSYDSDRFQTRTLRYSLRRVSPLDSVNWGSHNLPLLRIPKNSLESWSS